MAIKKNETHISRVDFPDREERATRFCDVLTDKLAEMGMIASRPREWKRGISHINKVYVGFQVEYSGKRGRKDLRYKVFGIDNTNYPEPEGGFVVEKAIERIQRAIRITEVKIEAKRKFNDLLVMKQENSQKACNIFGIKKSEYNETAEGEVNGIPIRVVAGTDDVAVTLRLSLDNLKKLAEIIESGTFL